MRGNNLMVFDSYARYYDLFYQNKDYAGEAQFVLELAEQQGAHPKRILDLGCGTGRHAVEWAKIGVEVHGIERSEQMLSQALARVPAEHKDQIVFSQADIRDFKVEPASFDVVAAMFAVLGYITDQSDLINMLKRIHKALRPGGLFVCDTWHGAAVLNEGPSDRMRVFERPEGKLYRFVQSRLDAVQQVVDVQYTLVDAGNSITVREETHRMRFFMKEEMRLLAQLTGFELVHFCPFMKKDRALSLSDWNVIWVFLKR